MWLSLYHRWNYTMASFFLTSPLMECKESSVNTFEALMASLRFNHIRNLSTSDCNRIFIKCNFGFFSIEIFHILEANRN